MRHSLARFWSALGKFLAVLLFRYIPRTLGLRTLALLLRAAVCVRRGLIRLACYRLAHLWSRFFLWAYWMEWKHSPEREPSAPRWM